jgi:hypothetical protein
MANEKTDPRDVRLFGAIVGYADGLFTPSAYQPGGNAMYSGTFIIMPDQAVKVTEQVERAALAAAEAKFGADRKNWKKLKGIHTEPLVKDAADFPKMGEFEPGTIFVRASSKDQPGFTDAYGDVMAFDDAKARLTSGWKVNVLLRAAGYDVSGTRGVKFYINVIQPMRHVMNLGGRVSPKGAFAPLSAEELGEAV